MLRWIPALLVLLPAAGPAEERPNVVLVMTDDQGWGDVGYQDHPVLKTPELDALAAAGLRFDRFYAAAPVCSPTRGSVLTGRTPNRFGCFQWGHSLRPQERTLPELLKEAGYATGHFGKWHLGSVRKGSPVNPGASGFDRWLSAENFFDNDPILSREGTATKVPGESSQVTADAALGFIREQAAAQRPFLAVVWFGSPHGPHRAADEDRAAYAGEGPKADFYGELAGVDRAVGRLRRELASLKLRENTLLWFCSDNGGLPGLGVTGGRAAKGSVYEGGLRVPGLIEWPARIPRARRTGQPACTVDILPTVLEAAGVKVPADRPLDGVSLMPLLLGGEADRPKPIGFWDHPAAGISTPSDAWMKELLEAQRKGLPEPHPERLLLDAGTIPSKAPRDSFPGHAAWLSWPWKLHRIQDKKGSVKVELYHLGEDPGESRAREGGEPERTVTLRGELEAWLGSVARSLNGEDY